MSAKIVPELTQEYVKSILDYSPKTGLLYWKDCKSPTVKNGSIAGSIHKTLGYRMVFVMGALRYAHRLIWLWNYGAFPKKGIDHINGDPSDNRLNNLRDANQGINTKNRRISSNNNSGIMGVSWDNFRQKWKAYIETDGKRIYMGNHADFFEACCRRKSAERKYGFHLNHGRSQ